MKKTATLLLAAALAWGCGTPQSTTGDRSDTLRVAIAPGVPGFVQLGSQLYGFARDILEIYAEQTDRQLILGYIAADSCNLYIDLPSPQGKKHDEVELFTTHYVLLASQRKFDQLAALDSATLADVVRGEWLLAENYFALTPDYAHLVGAMDGTILEISENPLFIRTEEVQTTARDISVCEKGEAEIVKAITGNVEEVWSFPSGFEIAVTGDDEPLSEFRAWFDLFRTGDDYRLLREIYLGDQSGNGFAAHRRQGSISLFDDDFRAAAAQQELDWRLLAAIAFVESHFYPYSVSPRGARGIMQIMPRVAESMGVSRKDMMKPNINIALAAQTLTSYRKMLNFDRTAPESDRLSILLAAYNAGIGTILNAREAVAQSGGNPDSWEDVAQYLHNRKADPEQQTNAADSLDISPEPLSEGETIGFVRKVTAKYEQYKRRYDL